MSGFLLSCATDKADQPAALRPGAQRIKRGPPPSADADSRCSSSRVQVPLGRAESGGAGRFAEGEAGEEPQRQPHRPDGEIKARSRHTQCGAMPRRAHVLCISTIAGRARAPA
ncbi:uncharacterized protein V6R79_016559 [Siganus canaliculatus]